MLDPSLEIVPERSPETATYERTREPLNALRCLLIAALMSGPECLNGLQEEIAQLGLPSYIDSRVEFKSIEIYARHDDSGDRAARRSLQGAQEGSPRDAVQFLLTLLTSGSELESTAAASGLTKILLANGHLPLDFRISARLSRYLWPYSWPYGIADPEWWPIVAQEHLDLRNNFLGNLETRIATLCWMRLTAGQSSFTEEVQQICDVSLALFQSDLHNLGGDDQRASLENNRRQGETPTSTIVHGTWAWKGDWWAPRGDFHDYLKNSCRSDLYSGGRPFSWSGAFSAPQRSVAANRLASWADEAPTGELRTVFAHSFGGEVAARATLLGSQFNELVLLSAPVTKPVQSAVDKDPEIAVVRVPIDPVLTAGLLKQRFRGGDLRRTFVLPWHYSHSSSHDPDVWKSSGIATHLKL